MGRPFPGASPSTVPKLRDLLLPPPMAAVLRGIDDLKVKGFRPDQMQAR